MSKIPTAEEELNAMFEETGFDIINKIQRNMVISSMKLFAKLHVEAALKEAKERCDDSTNSEGLGEYIEKAYPLENIK